MCVKGGCNFPFVDRWLDDIDRYKIVVNRLKTTLEAVRGLIVAGFWRIPSQLLVTARSVPDFWTHTELSKTVLGRKVFKKTKCSKFKLWSVSATIKNVDASVLQGASWVWSPRSGRSQRECLLRWASPAETSPWREAPSFRDPRSSIRGELD